MMMPPSPAMTMRFSLDKDDDDDDLALFNEMESKETENFLLLPSHDLEDSFSAKLRYFSDVNHVISIPGRGETITSRHMLDAADDEDKNDYDWLLTPPDTPLFPSLDDEPHPPQIDIILTRGRPRTKPVPISRSSSMDKSIRSSRGSASPIRSSPSQSLGHAIPSRKPSQSPNKATTPSPRSSTPTPRRISTVSLGIRGASPVKTSRGNSASPRLRAWQTSVQSRDSNTKSSSQSMSPTPTSSRSGSSLHGHDRGRVLSSSNKASVASSGNDDLDSLQSIHVGSLDRPSSRKGVKKSARIMPQNSAPKRSFDSALRQMDKRNPQHMFRPLLSSVPSTTFYVGRENSTVTTSSNTSSDHVAIFAPEIEGSDHNQGDGASETEKIFSSTIHEEVFSFDEIDILDANIGHDIINESLDILHDETRGPKIALGPTESEDSVCHVIGKELNDSSETSHVREGISELGCFENTATCSNCGCHYEVTDEAEKTIKLCPECRRENKVSETTLAVSEDTSVISAEEKPLAKTDQLNTVSKMPQVTDVDIMSVPFDEQAAEESLALSSKLIHGHTQQNPLLSSLVELDQSGVDYKRPDYHASDQQLKVDLLEGTGISVLLKMSSSSKGPLVQGRTFTATTLSYDDLSFARNSMDNFRSSTRRGSYSASSSVDFSPARHSDFRVQRQVCGRKLDVDTMTKRPSTASSISGTSSHHGLGLAVQENTTVNAECGIVEDNTQVPQQMQALEDAITEVIDADASSRVSNFVEQDKLESLDFSRVADASNSELLAQADDNMAALFPDHVEDHQNDHVDVMDAVITANTSTITESEVEGENYCQCDTTVVDDDQLKEQSVPNSSNDCVSEFSTSEISHGNNEGSTVTVEFEGGGSNNTRSMTLEEATNTILLCSSIIHDLAYEAATIAIEKERHSDPYEGSEPRVTILGKANSDTKESCGRISDKSASKNQKAKARAAVEIDVKSSPANKLKNDENVDESMPRIVGLPDLDKVDGVKPPNKLESKCNCIIM